jgi:hypothetical protein
VIGRAAVAVGLAVSISFGCTERPPVLVEVWASGRAPTFRFGFCDDPDQDPNVYLLELARLTRGERTEVCSTAASDTSATVGKSWTLGETRKGISFQGCRPLVAGEYLVSVRAGRRGRGIGARYFSISPSGALTPGKGTCTR